MSIDLHDDGEEIQWVTLGGSENKEKKPKRGFFKRLFENLNDPQAAEQVAEGMRKISDTLNKHL